ncbi:heme oxygenase-like protein [Eremomyces bilateralis CBS 781.70]|uniref:Heme oxygenase-like protein n=1 Tax=Eremomyces bilateralis CBS 781.70 TaxID=1392243 RepID=A0A6G1GDY1_9PEZI|nr:heme oxygenase-like protein [Eremomyces bilateralis CBS 781.70]KAF1816224.1 heme oxygenase-like protein [Eremomyces bilateralis CBS 781.70]
MGRHRNPDIQRSFVEFNDSATPSKCNKVRCLHCGYVRAKNTTRQIEHLQECQAYLDSPEAAAHLSANVDGTPVGPTMGENTTSQMLNGTHPNPNLQVHRRGPNQNKRTREGQPIAPAPAAPPSVPPPTMPSITQHLLNSNRISFQAGTETPFLSHAGCGTLAAAPLAQWMVQDGHYTRGYIQLIGAMIAKVRLPHVPNSQFHLLYRTMDLLIVALNNIRREMTFFEITATKYSIHLADEPPNVVTRAYLDLFNSVSSPSASLLEGMVVLWATEHCYRTAWLYAAKFTTTLSTPSNESHIAALHQNLIPNWTSPAFSKFVDACRSLVDDLANSTNIPNGKEEMDRCEQVFRQVCWLEEQFWPEVDGMGEEDDTARLGPVSHSIATGGAAANDPDQNEFDEVLDGVAEAATAGV